jgi:hypothetical protein
MFEGKEVLLKIITVNAAPAAQTNDKLALIEAVSAATNLQTAVINADRYSNEPLNLQLQKIVFERYGLLYERKRGEFADGVHNEYIEPSQIVERNLFFRILFAANGDLTRAVQLYSRRVVGLLNGSFVRICPLRTFFRAIFSPRTSFA